MDAADNTDSPTAETAGKNALNRIFDALKERKNFKLEAGAGAGKTYSLIQALRYIQKNKHLYLPRSDQRVACLTYTNVARDEIKARTDEDPAIFADTIHGFFWEMISPYQKALTEVLHSSPSWKELLADKPDLGKLPIEYDLGIRGIHEDRITLHHDDIPEFAIKLLNNEKFRSLIADKFPIIFIDEYQDSPAGLVETILSGQENDRSKSVIGFFGDHWQQIYQKTCGEIKHSSLSLIDKHANFRSDQVIVNFLNKLRPELEQLPREGAGVGSLTVYHTNNWPGSRLSDGVWKGQISHEAAHACLHWVKHESQSREWILKSKDCVTLMLTHKVIAAELGYPNLAQAFRYNNEFANKENPVIEFLVDTIEPAIQAYSDKKYGELFRLLGGIRPTLNKSSDKICWAEFFNTLISTTESGTVGEVLDLLISQNLFATPTRVVKRENDLLQALRNLAAGASKELTRTLEEHRKLRDVAYAEVRALNSYLSGASGVSTEHSVKGAEFDDVVVLVGGGWNLYDFKKMIAAHATHSREEISKDKSLIRSRNLFYVSASRAKHNLALLFLQELSDDALAVLQKWVGEENVIPIEFDAAGMPLSRPVD